MDAPPPSVPDHGVSEVAMAPAAPSPVSKISSNQSPKRRCRQCGCPGVPTRALDLCQACKEAVAEEVHGRVRRIHEIFTFLGQRGDLARKRVHYECLLQEAQALQRYERRGILTTCPPPSTLLADFQIMQASLEAGLQKCRPRAVRKGADLPV